MIRTHYNFKIYCITSISGKQYIGQTKATIDKRWKMHNCNNNNTVMGKAIKKYVVSYFSIIVLDKANTKKQANILEAFYIKKFNTLIPNGYNMSEAGGGCVPGFKHTEKVKKEISDTKKIYYSDPIKRKEQSERMGCFFNTPEGKEIQRSNSLKQNIPKIKEKIKNKLKIIRSTDEYRKAKSIEQKLVWNNVQLINKHSEIIKKQYENGRITWNKGKSTGPRSEETKRKISETLKNK